MYSLKLHWIPLVLFSLSVGFSAGCTPESEPEGPEMGSIQAYLEANPDQMIDEEVVSEEQEFDANE